ncbi:MAG TPA: N-acetylmuramoyl-L-alanine amidase [Malonomonas sp.]
MKWLSYCAILLCLSLLIVALPSLAAAETYAEIRSDYQRLMQSSQLQRQRSHWEKLIRRFDRFAEQNPNHVDAEKALFLKAKTWDGLSYVAGSGPDARQAITHYLDMVKRYPDSKLADDALFHAGQIAENRLKDDESAYAYYLQLEQQYPGADMVGDAKARLAVLPKPVNVTVPESVPVPEVKKTELVGAAPRLENIRYWSGPEYTRVVLDLNAPVVAVPHLLKGDDPRLYFDLVYTEIAPSLQAEIAIHNGVVQRIRTSQFNQQKIRVVIDLERLNEYKLVTLDNPYRIVIDVLGKAKQGAAQGKQPVVQTRPQPADDSIASILDTAANRQPTLHVPQQSKQQGLRLIVVDAGHGGKDPGAVGPRKVLEKNVTLEMAKRLAEKLRKELGVKVLLSRSTDEFIELRDRTAYANRVSADLFISLHANASNSSKAYGLETYFLNLSKNNQAAEVVARENGTTLQDVGNLEAILFDLMANAKINESSRLAAEVQQALVAGLQPHYSNIKDLGVKQGPFHVLLGATMPSVLVEAAFISNKREEQRLNSRDYQERVADAIVKGVKSYAATMNQVARK